MPNPQNSKLSIISPDDVRIIVDKAFDSSTEIVDYELRPYSNETVGFLGSHLNLEITVRRSSNGSLEKRNLFAKVVPLSSSRQSSFVRQRRFFNQEAKFYNEVMPLLQRESREISDDPWAPECYLANEEVIVLEDTRARGYAMRPGRTFEAEDLRLAARTLARMHAASVLAERRLRRSRGPGITFAELCPDACVEQIFDENTKSRGLFELLVSLVETIARASGREPKDEVGIAFDRVYDEVQRPGEKRHQWVISHGDSWSNNFMFSADEPPKCLIIDFQLARYGERMWDVAQLIYYSTTRETRNKEERRVVEAYHVEFNEAVGSGGEDDLVLPSLEESLEEYEEARMHSLFAAMFYYPFMQVGRDEYLKHEDDPEAMYDKYIIRLNNEAVLDLMKRDERYASRLTEIALEVADYCKKVADEKANGL